MNTRPALRDLYEEWMALTLSEADAIRAGDWRLLEDAQVAKRRLQSQILTAERLMPARREPDSPPGPDELAWRSVLAELVQMEKANNTALTARLTAARKDQANLEGSVQRLRKVRSSYAVGQRSIWHSYS